MKIAITGDPVRSGGRCGSGWPERLKLSSSRAAATEPDAPTGTFDFGGPEEMSMDELVRALNGGAAKLRHLPAPLARLAARFSPELTPALMDLLLRDNVAADPAAAAAKFGFEPTPLRAVSSSSS